MPSPLPLRIATLAAALCAGAAATAQAQTLDLRAASQRACLALAERQGFRVLDLARPVPMPGPMDGGMVSIPAETVRMTVHDGANQRRLRCVYHIGEMQAEFWSR